MKQQKSRRFFRQSFRICLSTVRRESQSAWRQICRRTISVKSQRQFPHTLIIPKFRLMIFVKSYAVRTFLREVLYSDAAESNRHTRQDAERSLSAESSILKHQRPARNQSYLLKFRTR